MTTGPQKLNIKARPWAQVFVDNSTEGLQTPRQLTFAVGTHRIRLAGPNDRTEQLTVIVDAKGIVVKSDRGATETFRVGRVAEIMRDWQ